MLPRRDGAPCGRRGVLSVSSNCLSLAEFPTKSEEKDGNSLALQFLSGEKVTVVASKTSRESDRCRPPFLHLISQATASVVENQKEFSFSQPARLFLWVVFFILANSHNSIALMVRHCVESMSRVPR